MHLYKEGERLQIEVGEHIFTTPPMPPKNQILYWDKPRENQFWRRQNDIPQLFYDYNPETEIDAVETQYSPYKELLSLSKDDTDKLIKFRDRELERRLNGVWFFNNGEPTYLTGDHYFALQWGAMFNCTNFAEPGSDYGQYYEFQRNGVFYYFNICEQTEHGVGGLLIKPKKTGITQAVALICLNRSMLYEQKTIRMSSITQDYCKTTSFKFVKYAKEKMPEILLPSMTNENLGEINWGPQQNKAVNKKARRDKERFLYSLVATVPTSETGFDGTTNFIAWLDEFPKYQGKTLLKEMFVRSKAAVKEGTMRKGTFFGTSYVTESNDDPYKVSKIQYWDSKLSNVNKDGLTPTELICHTLTVDMGIIGGCDKYGKPMLAEIQKLIQREVDKCNGDQMMLQATKRQYPSNERDPWIEGFGANAQFDILRLDMQEQELQSEEAKGLNRYEEYDLQFADIPVINDTKKDYKFGNTVHYHKIQNEARRAGHHGRFKWYRKELTPFDWLAGKVNKCTVDPATGLLKPPDNHAFFLACDPANYVKSAAVKQGSLYALQVFTMPDIGLDAKVNVKGASYKRTMSTYLLRNPDPKDTLLDIVKALIYFSSPILIECNTPWLFTHLEEWGFENFLIVLNVDTDAFENYNRHKMNKGKQKMYTSNAKAIDYYIKSGQNHYATPESELDVDHIKLLDDIPTIQQLKAFDPNDTRVFDAAVCNLTGLMGLNSYLGWKESLGSRNKRALDGKGVEFFRLMR